MYSCKFIGIPVQAPDTEGYRFAYL